jgi:hypothetical protein
VHILWQLAEQNGWGIVGHSAPRLVVEVLAVAGLVEQQDWAFRLTQRGYDWIEKAIAVCLEVKP